MLPMFMDVRESNLPAGYTAFMFMAQVYWW